jgi:tetratricopeptide (TPR) repeat protein
MKPIDFSYFIERYNAGEMSDSEKIWFLKELDGNDKLKKEVELRKRTDEVLKNQNVLSLRNKLAEIEKRRETQVPLVNAKRQLYLKYAAAFTGLVILVSIAIFSGKTISNDELIKKYYKLYEPPTSQRSAEAGINSDYTLALEYYNTQDYERAAVLFNKIVESNPKDMQSTLLSGVSNFENRKYPEAKKSFGRVIDNNNNLYIDQAEWYLALCYIKTDEKDKAIQQLEKIKNEEGIYKNDAKKILRKLK